MDLLSSQLSKLMDVSSVEIQQQSSQQISAWDARRRNNTMTKKADYIWFNGEMVPWADAKVHVMSHALHYGTSRI
ncbi:Branched-chain-amino-acid aminotransferase [Serratia fonticola]|uniref:Branched-chain-amino-acid aminotransferase n=1 Tax=Serratia fonticola TaxID=47917 RepID=A0A4U9WNX6_SERFO|nr:Branched-chain-amino-acid aminotransferase [Serratia fonticola]